MSHLDDSSLCLNKSRRMFIFPPLYMGNIQLEQRTFSLKLVILEQRETGESRGSEAPCGSCLWKGHTCYTNYVSWVTPVISQSTRGNGRILASCGLQLQEALSRYSPSLPGQEDLTCLRHMLKMRHRKSRLSFTGAWWKPLPSFPGFPHRFAKAPNLFFLFLKDHTIMNDTRLYRWVSENVLWSPCSQKT